MYNKNVKFGSDYYMMSNNIVSIILGVKYKDGIILATDSQASDKIAGVKKLGEKKIFSFNIDNSNFIYSGAENPNINQRIIDEIRGVYNSKIDFIKQCEDAYNKVKNMYPQQVNEGKLPINILIGIENNGLELIQIPPDGIVLKTKEIKAIGCRWEWVELIYSEILSYRNYDRVFNNKEEALRIILYTIDKIKRYDLYCGGKSQYIILHDNGEIEETDEKLVEKLEDDISKINNEFRERWWSKLGEEE